MYLLKKKTLLKKVLYVLETYITLIKITLPISDPTKKKATLLICSKYFYHRKLLSQSTFVRKKLENSYELRHLIKIWS